MVYVLVRTRRDDGSFGDIRKVFGGDTEQQRIEQLENDNAQLVYDNMMKDLDFAELQGSQSDLIYQLMQKGVL